jgi:hypothetical protein
MERHKPYRPPFWESKKFGEPYGDFNRVAKPKPVVVVAKPVAGMPTTDLKGRPVLRDNATLRASGKLSTGKAGGAAVAPVAALAKKTGRLSIKEEEAVDAAYRHNLAVGNRLQELEEQMRAALKARRQLHCAERELLTNAFRRTDPDKTRVVDVERFVQVWKSFGVEVTDREARAAFNKYGQTRDGSLPYPVFTEALLVGKARLVGMSSEVRRGAFPLNRPAEEYQFHGKILYPQCRKGGVHAERLGRSGREALVQATGRGHGADVGPRVRAGLPGEQPLLRRRRDDCLLHRGVGRGVR